MSLVQYKCPNCGGSLEFEPQSQKFTCEYCMSSFSKQQIDEIFELNETRPLTDADASTDADDEFSNNTSLYTCNNCGAQIIAENTASATFCYYCQSPVILTGRLSNEYRPSQVLQFCLTKNDAVDLFRKFCSKKWFLPSDFLSASQLEKLSGVYVPYWVADCDADGSAEFIGKKVRTWTTSDRIYTETQEYKCDRSAQFSYKRVPADGSSKFPDSLMEAIEPYDYSKLKPFSMSYLSGFMADKYDVNKESVFTRIRERISQGSVELMKKTVVGYNSVSPLQSDVKINKTEWNYVLLPVWFMTYKYGGKQFFYALNGQSGKIGGQLPLSRLKLYLFAGIIAAVVFAICSAFLWTAA